MRIGVTGYVRLTAGSTAPIYDALVDTVGRYPGARGVTCLAAGADQIFARAVLAQGGEYEVVLPAGDYPISAVTPDNRADFDELLERASTVDVLPYEHSDLPAFRAAGDEVLDRCDLLIAVWDEAADARTSCTAEVVSAARDRGKPVIVIWPPTATRLPPAPPTVDRGLIGVV